MSNINTLDLSKKVEGKLYGSNIELKGNFTFLNKASKNDIVIRHWINEKGIQIAHDKGVACLITQNPQGNTIEVAKELNLPLIVTEHIEYATAYALGTGYMVAALLGNSLIFSIIALAVPIISVIISLLHRAHIITLPVEPLHHTLNYHGMSEQKIILLYWGVTLVVSVIALFLFGVI